MQPLTGLAFLFSLLLPSTLVLADVSSCPGVFFINGPIDAHHSTATSACCVGGHQDPVVVSSCPGWPMCSGPATTSQQHHPLSCATVIPITDGNYYDLVSSASVSLQKSGTDIRTTLNNGGSAVTGTIGSTTSGGSSSSASAGSGSGSSSAQSTSSAGGAMGPVAAEMGVIAAGIFGAAVLL